MTIDASTLTSTIRNNGYKYTRAYTKQVREADDDVEDFQGELESFKKIVRKIHNYSSTNTTDDKLKTYLSDLKDKYNSLVKNKDSLTNSTLQKKLDKLDALIDDNAKALKKLGLKKTDGKLEFDEDTFDDDDNDKKSTIKKLFEGTDSFGDQLYKITRDINKSAAAAQYVTTEYHLSSTTKYNESELIKAENYSVIQPWGQMLNTLYNAKMADNGVDYNSNDDILDIIDQSLEYITSNINYLNNDEGIVSLCKDNAENLEKLGITYDETDNKFTYEPIKDSNDRNTIDSDAFDALFNGSEDSFYSKLIAKCKEGYNKTMKTDTIGVKIDKYV